VNNAEPDPVDFLMQVEVPSSPDSATRGDIVVTVLEVGGDEWVGVAARHRRVGRGVAAPQSVGLIQRHPRRVGPLGHGPRHRRWLHLRRGSQ